MSNTERRPDSKLLLADLLAGHVEPLPDQELSWSETIDWLHVEGRIVEVSAETYDYFLDVLPPRYMRGSLFAFCEGYDRFLLFWKAGGKYLARQLSDDETKSFCRVTGASQAN
ncbi:MAG: DUF1419 domain-containing protein [Pirellulales bacterium]|nr:DUF1419 domain-containing protein [Pirellulales bacterium]